MTLFTLDPTYFPVFSFILICYIVFSLRQGWKKGFLRKIVELALLAATIFIAWPVAKALANMYPLWLDASTASMTLLVVNRCIWFLIVQIVLRILASFLYGMIKFLHKLKLFGFFDKMLGMLTSAVITLVTLGILVIFLEMPFIGNGSVYVNSTPLVYLKDYMDTHLDLNV